MKVLNFLLHQKFTEFTHINGYSLLLFYMPLSRYTDRGDKMHNTTPTHTQNRSNIKGYFSPEKIILIQTQTHTHTHKEHHYDDDVQCSLLDDIINILSRFNINKRHFNLGHVRKILFSVLLLVWFGS